MTTDPTPLQERIARTVWSGFADDQGYEAITWEELPGHVRGTYLHTAAAVLPIITAEVRKAQADAWDGGQASGWDEAQEQWQINGMVGDAWKHSDTPNPYREQED